VFARVNTYTSPSSISTSSSSSAAVVSPLGAAFFAVFFAAGLPADFAPLRFFCVVLVLFIAVLFIAVMLAVARADAALLDLRSPTCGAAAWLDILECGAWGDFRMDDGGGGGGGDR